MMRWGNQMRDLGYSAGTAGMVAVAAFASAQHAADQGRIQRARNFAAISRATAAVYAESADELRRDLILQKLENADLQERVDEAKDDLKAERARTESLAAMLVDARNPNLSPAQRRTMLAEALSVIRTHRTAA